MVTKELEKIMNGKEFGIPQTFGNYPIMESKRKESHRRARIKKVPEMAIIRDFGHEFDIVINANLETQVEGYWVSGDGRLDYKIILDPATRPDEDFDKVRPGGFLKESWEKYPVDILTNSPAPGSWGTKKR